jgi:hypothetical protein
MADVPDVLLGVLRQDDTLDSLKAIRDMLGKALSANQCDECERYGPDYKDIAPLTNRLMDCLAKIDALAEATSVPQAASDLPSDVPDLSAIRSRVSRRTGGGTETTQSPQSAARRQDARRPRHKGSDLPR